MFGSFGQHRNHGARLRDIIWQGRRCISLENAVLRTVIALDKGCDILELTHKPSDTEMLYQAPAGMFPPMAMPSSPLDAGHFRDQFPGGWYLMLPNGPGPCEHAGARFGQHGEATLLPWDYTIEADSEQRVAFGARVRLRRTPLLAERRITLTGDAPSLVIDEVVTNESPHPIDVLWGHHPTFGAPLIDPGTRIDCPSGRLRTNADRPPAATLPPNATGHWPHIEGQDLSRFPASGGDTQDFVRLDAFDRGWFAVRNPARRAGVALRWDETLFPLLGYWRLAGGGPGYPWYGSRTMLALEPCNDLPSIAEAAARGTAIRLAPGERRETRLVAHLFAADTRAVTDMAWDGALAFGEPDDAA